MEGVLEVAALGNLCEAGSILQRGHYGGNVSAAMAEETVVARWQYRQFQVYMARNYTVLVDDKPVSVFWVFRRSLVEFLAALLTYKKAWEHLTPVQQPGCNSSALLKTRIQKFFKSEYPELLECWKALVLDGHNSFYWTGPAFSLVPLTRENHIVETNEVEDWEIYNVIPKGTPVESEDDEDSQSVDEEEEGEGEESSGEGSLALVGSSREPVEETSKGRVSKRKLDAGDGGEY